MNVGEVFSSDVTVIGAALAGLVPFAADADSKKASYRTTLIGGEPRPPPIPRSLDGDVSALGVPVDREDDDRADDRAKPAG